jgi:hypothetical protein
MFIMNYEFEEKFLLLFVVRKTAVAVAFYIYSWHGSLRVFVKYHELFSISNFKNKWEGLIKLLSMYDWQYFIYRLL